MNESSSAPRWHRALLSCLSYSNVMSTLAVFVVLGGASYAAVTLPRNSVGPAQLRAHSVTHSKLAPGSVARRSLSPWVRRNLEEKATGAPGPAGSAGRDGAGASGIRFSAPAESTPTPVTALNTAGLELTVDCRQSGSTVGLEISARSAEDATLHETASIDTGTDPSTFAPSDTINGQIALAANTDTSLGGPTADPPQYFRVVASIVYVTSSRTMSLSIVALVNAVSGRCSLDGTVTPTS